LENIVILYDLCWDHYLRNKSIAINSQATNPTSDGAATRRSGVAGGGRVDVTFVFVFLTLAVLNMI